MSPSNIIKDPWKTLESHELFKRMRFAYGVYKDRYILVVGGCATILGHQFLKSALMYDMHTESYSVLPDLPEHTCPCVGTISQNHFYAVGRGKILRMELSSRLGWEQIQSPEIKGYTIAVFSDKNDLYILSTYGITLYDSEQNTCTPMPPAPTPRSNCSTAKVANDIYIIGGCGLKAERYLSSVEVFNIFTQSWSAAPPLPKPLEYAAAVAGNGLVFVTGGRHDNHVWSSQSFIYDTRAKLWIQNNIGLSPLRVSHGFVAIAKELVSIGGQDLKEHHQFAIQTIHKKYLFQNWDVIKDLLLLRKLVDKKRAFVVKKNQQLNDEKEYIQEVLEKIITEIDLDVFKEVLSFLV